MATQFVSIRSSSLTLPGGESFSSIRMIAASFSNPSGLHSPTLRFLQMPVELLVTEQSSRVTGFQVHRSQHRSLLLSSTGTFPYFRGSLPLGSPMGRKTVNFLSDNRSVVDILQSGTSRAPIMSLVRYLSLLAARHSFSFTASPVRGKSNPIADSLSRFQFQRFCRLAPHADSIPT